MCIRDSCVINHSARRRRRRRGHFNAALALYTAMIYRRRRSLGVAGVAHLHSIKQSHTHGHCNHHPTVGRTGLGTGCTGRTRPAAAAALDSPDNVAAAGWCRRGESDRCADKNTTTRILSHRFTSSPPVVSPLRVDELADTETTEAATNCRCVTFTHQSSLAASYIYTVSYTHLTLPTIYSV